MAIRSFWTSFGKSIGSIMAAPLRDELHIVVTDCGDGTWEWEICRRGEPLPARMRDGPFNISRRRSPLRLAKSHSGNSWSFWDSPPEASPQHGTVSSAVTAETVPFPRRVSDCPLEQFRSTEFLRISSSYPNDARGWQSSVE